MSPKLKTTLGVIAGVLVIGGAVGLMAWQWAAPRWDDLVGLVVQPRYDLPDGADPDSPIYGPDVEWVEQGKPEVNPKRYESFWAARLGEGRAEVPGGTRPVFTDVTSTSGVDFQHRSPGVKNTLNPQMKGPGLLALDANGDGITDLLFPDYSAPALGERGPRVGARLYLGLGDMRYRLAPAGFGDDVVGMGGAAGDVDGDGDLDLLLTAFGGVRFYLNNGDGTFVEATEKSGLKSEKWPTSAAFLDYDQDGRLDLVILGYVDWDRAWHERCAEREQNLWIKGPAERQRIDLPGVSGPSEQQIIGGVYPGCLPEQRTRLFQGLGDGTFADVTEGSGIGAKPARGLGLAILDLEDDRRPDILVANDNSPTHLWSNQGGGRFKEIGLTAGLAYDTAGHSRAGMGVDAAYLFDTEQICLSIGFYDGEDVPLYCQEPGRPYRFRDVAPRRGPDSSTNFLVTFGLLFADYDLDGRQDLFLANGHVSGYASGLIENPVAKQPTTVYQNTGERLEEWVLGPDDPLGRPVLGRGLVRGDLDGDGDLDLVVGQNGGPPLLLRNDTPRGGRHWLAVRLQGRRSNPHGLGAHLRLDCGGVKQHHYLTAAPSFMGRCEPVAHFGLGACPGPAKLTVLWPSGMDTAHELAVDQAVTLEEGE